MRHDLAKQIRHDHFKKNNGFRTYKKPFLRCDSPIQLSRAHVRQDVQFWTSPEKVERAADAACEAGPMSAATASCLAVMSATLSSGRSSHDLSSLRPPGVMQRSSAPSSVPALRPLSFSSTYIQHEIIIVSIQHLHQDRQEQAYSSWHKYQIAYSSSC